jgi:hypothetical protein
LPDEGSEFMFVLFGPEVQTATVFSLDRSFYRLELSFLEKIHVQEAHAAKIVFQESYGYFSRESLEVELEDGDQR